MVRRSSDQSRGSWNLSTGAAGWTVGEALSERLRHAPAGATDLRGRLAPPSHAVPKSRGSGSAHTAATEGRYAPETRGPSPLGKSSRSAAPYAALRSATALRVTSSPRFPTGRCGMCRNTSLFPRREAGPWCAGWWLWPARQVKPPRCPKVDREARILRHVKLFPRGRGHGLGHAREGCWPVSDARLPDACHGRVRDRPSSRSRR